MDDLTAPQAAVLRFMAEHITTQQRPPTRKEICGRFGWASGNAAETHIQALTEKGYLTLDGAAAGSQWQRYPRIVRWPADVLPLIRLGA